MRVLVLGAGFGGLELTTRLSDAFGDDIEIVPKAWVAQGMAEIT